MIDGPITLLKVLEAVIVLKIETKQRVKYSDGVQLFSQNVSKTKYNLSQSRVPRLHCCGVKKHDQLRDRKEP